MTPPSQYCKRLGWTLYGAISLVPFLCVADQALGHLGFLPASATALCALIPLPFVFNFLCHHIKRRTLSTTLGPWSDNASPLAAFFGLAALALVRSTTPGAYWDEGGKWIFLIPYGFMITALSIAIGLHRPIVRNLRLYAFLSLLLIACSVWYDLNHPGTFSEIQNRAAGFSGNANYSALVSVLVCSVGIDFGKAVRHRRGKFTIEPKRSSAGIWVDIVMLLLCFTIVTMTMSRSGLVAFLILGALFLFFRFLRTRDSTGTLLHFIIAGGLAVSVVICTLPVLTAQISAGDRNNRLSRLLHGQQIDDGSAGTRLAAVVDSVRLIEEAPVLGHGTGFSRTMLELPHNLYLQQWINNGVIGLVCYLALLATCFWVFLRRGSRTGQVFMIIAAVGSLFSHNVLDQRPFLMLLGILLAASLADQHTPSTPRSRLQRQTDSMRCHARRYSWADPTIQQ